MPAVPTASFWRGKRVLVTGHTGFVGGWLCAWLVHLGARVSGYALVPPTEPSFFARTGLTRALERSTLADVNDAGMLANAVQAADPQVAFHLAAQPIVREAFREPLATFATNVQGTANFLEACRQHAAAERIVVYTTDKVYRNDQSGRAFSEADRIGGAEPYSASKAAAEWVVAAWWESYFRRAVPCPALSVVRAGNIVGGGDWACERLLPDAVRAFAAGKPLVLRNPAATRPWQHVLDAVRGTLVLAERGADARAAAEDIAWNFGPAGAVHPVSAVADAAVKAWGGGAAWRHEPDGEAIPEAKALVLSSERAARELGWRMAWDLERSVERSIAWYRASGDLLAFTHAQVEEHVKDAA